MLNITKSLTREEIFPRCVIVEKIYSSRDWTKIIDASVYGSLGTKGSGFRLPWSHKKTVHSVCKGAGCTLCDGGKIVEGEYRPFFTYSSGLLTEIDQDITMETLLLATVRTTDTNVVVIPELVILCQPVPRRRQEGDFTPMELKNEIYDSDLVSLLQTFIRKSMPGNEETKVLAIFKFKNVHLLKTTSRYCENIRRNHNSNHVKIVIDNGFIYQKCFCRCETTEGRRLGFCKDFTGNKHKLETNGGTKICKILYNTLKK